MYSGGSGLSIDIHFVDIELSYDVLSPLPTLLSKHFNHPHPYIEIATAISDTLTTHMKKHAQKHIHTHTHTQTNTNTHNHVYTPSLAGGKAWGWKMSGAIGLGRHGPKCDGNKNP